MSLPERESKKASFSNKAKQPSYTMLRQPQIAPGDLRKLLQAQPGDMPSSGLACAYKAKAVIGNINLMSFEDLAF